MQWLTEPFFAGQLFVQDQLTGLCLSQCVCFTRQTNQNTGVALRKILKVQRYDAGQLILSGIFGVRIGRFARVRRQGLVRSFSGHTPSP